MTPPVLWLPQNEIGNSPSTPALIPPGHGPYSGQMCHADVTQGGVQRDFIEKVDGGYQGCVFRWTQGLEAGVNRLTFGPDGALYVGGIGSTGDWGQAGKQRFGLQRLAYNGKTVFEPLALRAKSDGFELEFTEPLAPDSGWERESYAVSQWRYEPTESYGGPKIDERTLAVSAVAVSADRRKVDLWIDGLEPGHVVYLHLAGGITSESGRAPWTTEAWYTLNRIPAGATRDRARAPLGHPSPRHQHRRDIRQERRLRWGGQPTPLAVKVATGAGVAHRTKKYRSPERTHHGCTRRNTVENPEWTATTDQQNSQTQSQTSRILLRGPCVTPW